MNNRKPPREFWINPYMIDFAKYDICTVEEDQGRFPLIKYIHVREVLPNEPSAEEVFERVIEMIRKLPDHCVIGKYEQAFTPQFVANAIEYERDEILKGGKG